MTGGPAGRRSGGPAGSVLWQEERSFARRRRRRRRRTPVGGYAGGYAGARRKTSVEMALRRPPVTCQCVCVCMCVCARAPSPPPTSRPLFALCPPPPVIRGGDKGPDQALLCLPGRRAVRRPAPGHGPSAQRRRSAATDAGDGRRDGAAREGRGEARAGPALRLIGSQWSNNVSECEAGAGSVGMDGRLGPGHWAGSMGRVNGPNDGVGRVNGLGEWAG